MTATVEAPAKRVYIHRSPQEKYERSAEIFEKVLYRRAKAEGVQAARRTAQVAYELGGAEGAVRLLYLRLVGLQFEDQDEVQETLALYISALNVAKLKFRAAGGDPPAAEAEAEAAAARRAQLERRTRDQHQQWAQQQAQHRERIANSVPAKSTMSRTAALEAAYEAPSAVDHDPTTGGRNVTRRARSTCGEKLSRKIDALLQELRAEEPAPPIPVSVTPLDWERSHGEVDPSPEVSAEPEPEPIPEPEPASAAPPAPMGAGVQSADASAISSGGAAGGLSYYELPSLWQLLTDTTEDAAITTPLTQLLDQMEDSPVFRRGQVAGAIADLQAALEQVSHQADGDDRLSLPVGTVVILAHVLLRHMP